MPCTVEAAEHALICLRFCTSRTVMLSTKIRQVPSVADVSGPVKLDSPAAITQGQSADDMIGAPTDTGMHTAAHRDVALVIGGADPQVGGIAGEGKLSDGPSNLLQRPSYDVYRGSSQINMQSLTGPASYLRTAFSPVPGPRAWAQHQVCISGGSGSCTTCTIKPNAKVSTSAMKVAVSSQSKYGT